MYCHAITTVSDVTTSARKVEQNRRQVDSYCLVRDTTDFSDFVFVKVVSSFAFLREDKLNYRAK